MPRVSSRMGSSLQLAQHPQRNWPGWDCLGGNKGDGEVLA